MKSILFILTANLVTSESDGIAGKFQVHWIYVKYWKTVLFGRFFSNVYCFLTFFILSNKKLFIPNSFLSPRLHKICISYRIILKYYKSLIGGGGCRSWTYVYRLAATSQPDKISPFGWNLFFMCYRFRNDRMQLTRVIDSRSSR